jgi:hypothetical protein
MKGKNNGKVIEWTRLDGRGDDDAGYVKPTFRPRRVNSFTAWDWCNWWSKRGSGLYVRCTAGLALAEDRGRNQKLALLATPRPGVTLLCSSARTRL